MKIAVLNGSPAGPDSITLFTLQFIQKHFPEHQYEILHVGQRIRALEKDPSKWTETLRTADLIIAESPRRTA